MQARVESNDDDDGQDEEDDGHEHEHFLAPGLLQETSPTSSTSVRRLGAQDLGHGGATLGSHRDAIRKARRLEAGYGVGHVAQGSGKGGPTPNAAYRQAEFASQLSADGHGNAIKCSERPLACRDGEGHKLGNRRQLLRHSRRPGPGGLCQGTIVRQPAAHRTHDEESGHRSSRHGSIAHAEEQPGRSTHTGARRAPDESLKPVGVGVAFATRATQPRGQVGAITTHQPKERRAKELAESVEGASLSDRHARSAQAICEAQWAVGEDGGDDQGDCRTHSKPDKGSDGTHASTLGSSGSRPIAVMTR